MLICPKCGTELNDGVVYCSKCGTNVTYQSQPSGGAQQNTAQQKPFQNNASQQNYNGTTSDKFKAGVNNAVNKTKTFFFDTADETSMQDASDVQENKFLALISYLGYFFFIPMIVKPYSRYLRFHGNQGLTLCLYLIAVSIVNTVITSIIGIAGYSGMGALIAVTIINSIISIIFYGSFVLLAAIGIYNAVKGFARELPVIGRIRILREY